MDSVSKKNTTSKMYNGPQPVKICDMNLELQNAFLSNGSSSAKKSFKFPVPVRMCDMDPSIFEPDRIKKNVRKQLWSTEKDRKRFTTSMKPDKNSVRKMLYKKTPTATADESILTDLENFELNPNKFKTKSMIQTLHKKNLNEKLNFNSNRPSYKLNKPPKLPTPTIIINGSEKKRASEKFNKKHSPPKNKNESMDNILKDILKKLDEVTSLGKIQEQKLESASNKLDDVLHKLNLKFNEISKRMDNLELSNKCKLCGCKTSNTFAAGTAAEYLNNSCFIGENLTEKTPEMKSSVKINTNESLTSLTTPDVNKLINTALSNINSSTQIYTETTVEQSTEIVNPSCAVVPEINHLEQNDNKLSTERKKLLNTFELLESKLEFYSPLSDEFSISYNESPAINKDINCLINDKEELCKSASTSSVLDKNTKKSVSFVPKPVFKDSVEMYNEMKNSCKILYTPKNTRTVSNLLTPSIDMSQKKKISLRIQKQLLMLDSKRNF